MFVKVPEGSSFEESSTKPSASDPSKSSPSVPFPAKETGPVKSEDEEDHGQNAPNAALMLQLQYKNKLLDLLHHALDSRHDVHAFNSIVDFCNREVEATNKLLLTESAKK